MSPGDDGNVTSTQASAMSAGVPMLNIPTMTAVSWMSDTSKVPPGRTRAATGGTTTRAGPARRRRRRARCLPTISTPGEPRS